MQEDNRSRRWVAGSVAAILALTVSGCAGESRSGSDQPGVPGPPAVSTDAPDPATQTSIGTSSQDDIAAALRTNDVDDAGRWAEVVFTSRPFPPGAAGEAKLREVLARFQADPETTTKVTATLAP